MTDDPLIGQMIDGRYKITGIIGRGGMAVVYRATQPAMEREVAIKVIAPEVASGEGSDFLGRFEREARIVARLEHPHILPVYDFGQYNGQPYLVMRLLEGGDLKDRMTRKPFTLDESNRLIGQLAGALTYAHEAGIIHRDLKPQNILIDVKGNPYLMDFGIAKALGATKEMTATGTIMGTPSYMAPEQWRAEAVDARTDIYALGVIAYALLTGNLPFESDTPFSLMYMHLDEMPEPVEARNSALPANLTEVIFKAMAKDPADRFGSAVDFAEGLNEAIHNPGTTMRSRRADVEYETFVGDRDFTLATDTGSVPTLMSAASAENTGATKLIDDMEATSALIHEQDTARVPVVPQAAEARGLPLMWVGAGAVLVVIVLAAAFLILNGGDSTPPQEDVVLEAGKALVTATRGIIYAEPDTLSEEVTIAPDNSELTILGVSEDKRWYQVEFLGNTGWILADQIQVFGDVNTIAVIASPTALPSTPTLNVPTAVACVLTAQSGEVNVRSLPSTAADSAVVTQIFGGDTVTATAQTPDGWYLTELGWIFGSVMRLSSPFVCGSLPLIRPGVEVAAAPETLCEVLTSDAALYQGASPGSVALTSIPPSTTLPVFEVAAGEEGNIWYRTLWKNPDGMTFQGWVMADAAGPVAGSCPNPTGGISLFGNPYINPLGLPEPTASDSFNTNSGQWDLMVPGNGEIQIEDGLLRMVINPRQSNSLIITNNAVGEIGDAYISVHLTVPPGLGESYFIEEIVRAFYSVRMSELGGIAIAAEANPSLLFGSTQDGIVSLDEGITLGVHLQGTTIAVYANGKKVLEVEDSSRESGVLLRFRVSNRSQENPVTLLVDDFAYWDLSE